MKIGYARVNTKEQSLDMRIFALEDAGCEKIYDEVVSGAKSESVQRQRIYRIDKNKNYGSLTSTLILKFDRCEKKLLEQKLVLQPAFAHTY